MDDMVVGNNICHNTMLGLDSEIDNGINQSVRDNVGLDIMDSVWLDGGLNTVHTIGRTVGVRVMENLKLEFS